jgi:peptidoglycan/xylan/chitin deacetylase (PgdA/CDA1 family)
VKHFLYFILFYSGLLAVLLRIHMKRTKRHPAIILFYHRFKEGRRESLPPRMEIGSFEKQMRYVRKWYRIISLDELVDTLEEEGEFRFPSLVITIDDGFRDNYDLAFPVLRRSGVPSTVYLTSALIGTGEAPWIDEIGYALWSSRRNEFRLAGLFGDRVICISSERQKHEAWHAIYENMLYLPHEKKVELVEEVIDELRMGEVNSGTDKGRVMLDWAEAKKMSENGVSLGAHTLSHPTLSMMSFDNARFEIEESKRIIEDKCGCAVEHFAIPNGRDEDFSEELREWCKKGQFRSVVTTNFGAVKEGSDPYALPRVSLNSPLFMFAVELARLFIRH